MLKTIAMSREPVLDEFNIVATFSDESLAALEAIQAIVKDILGNSVWIAPRRALHSTLMEITCDGDLERHEHFQEWQEQSSQAVSSMLATYPSFAVLFNELVISERAIIIKSADSHAYNDIRAQLLGVMHLSDATKQPPDITHCTIARYNESLNVNQVRQSLCSIKVDITEPITKFCIVKDLGPPDFSPKTVQTYTLKP